MGYSIKGIFLIYLSSLLSFVATILLIVAQVGQINTSSVPRRISMAEVNLSTYGHNLAQIFNDPIEGLYTSNASAPLGQQQGVRQFYKFGLYSYCAYLNDSAGKCSNHTAAFRFQPYAYIVSDMSANYTQFTNAFYAGSQLENNSYLGSSSQAAYWTLLLGTLCAVIALAIGLIRHTVSFLLSTCFAILGSVLLLIAASVWTVILKKVETVNTFTSLSIPLGIYVSASSGLTIIWAAFGCLMASTIPYMLACCTYRG